MRFIGEFCENCAISKINSKISDLVTLQECKSCGNVKTNLGYENRSKEVFQRAIYVAMHKSAPNCSIELLELNRSSADAVVRFRCTIGEENVEFEKELHVKFVKALCERCYKIKAGYYEAVVKLRGDNLRINKLLGNLEVFVTNSGSFISRIEEQGSGYDVYIGEKKVVNDFFSINKKITPIKAYEFYKVKDGKKLYRNIYSVRFE